MKSEIAEESQKSIFENENEEERMLGNETGKPFKQASIKN